MNEFKWCLVLRNLLFGVVVRWLRWVWSTLTCLLCILCTFSIVRLAGFLRCSRVDHFNSLSIFVALLVKGQSFWTYIAANLWTISILCVRCFCQGCHMVEQYSTWGLTYVLYAAYFSCLFCVLTFCLMHLRLFLTLFVIMFIWDDWFLFSVYSENFTLVRVKFHWPLFLPKF